ncbi:hypothetical protein AWL63_22960 (plasmid) [Sphingomonas panacis]|uniref:UspA domain-containing protein n=1 Tax=Sphingomonas panacis TaxID=1560345 RepID=A0A1B3ZI04_9SPHN|nr:universal stress protein [Sphingomonas panacis]AOH87054.1 hypothetical protein AWL63_22960 [Sphingomonas panacis]
MIRDILVVVDTGDADEAFIADAIALSSSRGARLIIGVACPIPVPGSASAHGLPDATAAEFNRAVDAKEKRIWALADKAGITVCTLLDDPTLLLKKVVAQASLSQLVLFGPSEAYGSPDFRRELVEAVVFASGRPVVMLPKGAGAGNFARIAVGWNGTREAARALHAAMSVAGPRAHYYLAAVDIATEGDRRSQPTANDVVRHLHSLGWVAEAHHVGAGEQTTAAALIAFSQAHGADLIAAGAYGHSRFREWIFGGVTRDLLRGADIAVLLEH